MTITLWSLQALIIPVMLGFALAGYRRGFYREVGNFLVLLIGLSLTVAEALGSSLVGFFNRVITLGPRIINLLLGRGEVGAIQQAPIPEDLDSGANLFFRLVIFIVIAVLTYTLIFPWERDPKGAIRKPGPTNYFEKLLGALFGAGIGFIFYAAFQSFFSNFFRVQGRPVPLQNPLTLNLGTPQGIDTVLGLLPTLAVLALVILLILILFRLPRIWS